MGKNKSSIIHDQIISNLTQKLISLDYFVLWEYNYGLPNKKNILDAHEADILAIQKQKRYAYVIEVKKSNTRKSRIEALRQLKADHDFVKQLFRIDKINMLYA